MSLNGCQTFEAEALPYLNELYRTARHTLGNQTEAEDIVQETLLQAWKSFHRFQPGTNCRAWLYKIMFNVVRHHRRKWGRWLWHSDSEETVLETLVYEPAVPQGLRDEEVLDALDKLPTQFRAVVILADVEDFAYREIAEVLSVPIGTVMSRLNRGRKLLRAALAGYAITACKRERARSAMTPLPA